MKFSTLFFLALLPGTMATYDVTIGECEPIDCDLDTDCAPGLLCADAHKAELAAAGCDQRKAYCGSDVGGTTDELCYDPASECSTPPDGELDKCEVDCDVDSDCKPGLLCADAHKEELEEAGFDVRKADCGPVGLSTDEVCFDPAILHECDSEYVCGLSLIYCGGTDEDTPRYEVCVCDVDIHGDPTCWNNVMCSGLPSCSANSDCADGWVCATHCCGTTCTPPCGYSGDRRLHSDENNGLRSRELDCHLSAIGCIAE